MPCVTAILSDEVLEAALEEAFPLNEPVLAEEAVMQSSDPVGR